MTQDMTRKATPWRERDALSVPEAGNVLGLCKVSAYEAAARGEIPTIRIGKRLIVPRKALERLLESV
jgi:excisionase family DNA binding protein